MVLVRPSFRLHLVLLEDLENLDLLGYLLLLEVLVVLPGLVVLSPLVCQQVLQGQAIQYFLCLLWGLQGLGFLSCQAIQPIQEVLCVLGILLVQVFPNSIR